MKKRIATVALACLMVMTTMVGAAMAADTGIDALALSGVDVSDVKAVPATSVTSVSVVGGVSNRSAVTDVVKLEDLPNVVLENVEAGVIADHARATSSVNWNIDRNSTKKATTSFSLEAEETVTINCSYSPSSASVDFGLIAPDNRFYYLTGSDGSFNETLQVTQRGLYYLAIRNNSSNTVTVTGFVNY